MTARQFSFAWGLLALLWLIPLQESAAQTSAWNVSIYEFIRSNIDPATGRLKESATTLPDEPQWRRFSRFRTAPGALEGNGTHVQWAASEKAKQVAELLVRIAGGDAVSEQALRELLRADDVQTYYEQAIESAAAQLGSPGPDLHEFARRLTTQSTERAPVKFGIALLGAIADPIDLSIVLTLGLHDEFGMYAAEALAELAPEPQSALWQMARQVSGWGRVQAVARMAAPADPQLREWLLTEGFRNSVGSSYPAAHCADIADLRGMLASKRVETRMLVGAADLLRTLAEPDPARERVVYPDWPQAARLFLEQVGSRRDSLSYFLAARALLDFTLTVNLEAEVGGWTAEQRKPVEQLSERIIGDRVWVGQVKKVVADDYADLPQAELAAQKLGVDTFDIHMRRLARNSAVPARWIFAFRAAGDERVSAVVSLAERRFARPLEQFDRLQSHSPANVLDAREIEALEAVLQGLAQYPGWGTSLISPAITSPYAQVRRAAIDALVHWGGAFAARSDSIRKRLDSAARVEPDEALQARIVALLNSE